MEIILVVVIFRLMMQKSYKPDSKKGLTEKVRSKAKTTMSTQGT